MTSKDTYTLAFRLVGNEEDASDVVQEAYLRAYKGIGKFRGDAQFSTWMYRITANCANTQLSKRRRDRHEELTDDDSLLADTNAERDPQASLMASSLRDRLTVALEELPPKLRAVVVLRDVYDLPHEAIATELGISETAAKVRLHRARRKLRESIFPVKAGEEDTSRAV
ncbi:MAG: polymerase sigma-70 factor, subfamily [Actinomycetota bacterium]|nr:polymerase sigma-70 factor, subfamily [Actinomycetota bacterium]